MEHKYTIAVDFDGVLHSYTSRWVNAETILDPPVDGAIAWLNEISKKFDVVILTTRGRTVEGRVAVWKWLYEHGVNTRHIMVTAQKVPALIYLDDRGVRFDGKNFPSAEEVHRLIPWNKQK